MAEAWDALSSARRQRGLCSDKIKELAQACARDNENKHITECGDRYRDLLDCIKGIYTASPDMDWLAAQNRLAADLDKLFSRSKQQMLGLDAIEQRINLAKRHWARQTVRDSRVVKRLLRESGHSMLLQKLDDEAAIDVVLEEIGKALASRPASTQDLDGALERLIAARVAEQRAQAVKDIFSLDAGDSSGPLDAAMEQVLEKSVASKTSRQLKEKHRKRLDELRRARAAHENLKTKKTKHRRVQDDKPPSSPAVHMPPCATCSGPADANSFVACSLCQIRADLCGQGQPTVFCSSPCYREGFEAHAKQSHLCSSGDDCIRLRDDGEDEDTKGESSLVVCSDCLGSPKTMTPYCSEACAEVNFDRHQRAMHDHGPDAPGEGGEAGARHHARNIEAHLKPLSQALLGLEQSRSISVKAVD